jgi:hypothetical protein
VTPEGAVKKQIIAWLKTLPSCWYFLPVSNGMGVHGIPDIICCINGYFVGIEVKAPGKIDNTTPLQRMQITRIIGAGGLAIVADSLDGAKVGLVSLLLAR